MLGKDQNGKVMLLFLTYIVASSPWLHVIVQATPSAEIIEESPSVSDVLKWNTEHLSERNNDVDDDALLKLAADKRYMRFGRAPTEEKRLEEEKRYMRFGRVPSEWFRNENLAADKRYMRFGRTLRDQLSAEENQDAEKRYMRFGRMYDADEQSGIEEDKRYMRFGRDAGEEDRKEDKRYMRFGRGAEEEERKEDKRYMRFGRVPGEEERREDKRYMRFGKRVFYDTAEPDAQLDATKRYMRFGKRLPGDYWSKYEDRLPTDKRYMRFGRSVSSEREQRARMSRSIPSNRQTFVPSSDDSAKVSGKLPKTMDNGNNAFMTTDLESNEKMSVTL